MADYKLLKDGAVRRSLDAACIPPDPDNGDYAAYLAWVSDGNVPDPMDLDVPAVPQSVTPRQARLALSQAGLLPQVNAMIRVADEASQITWDYATEIRRDWPLIIALGTQLGLTSEQIDELFVSAATL